MTKKTKTELIIVGGMSSRSRARITHGRSNSHATSHLQTIGVAPMAMGYLDFQGESPKNLEEKSCCVFVLDTSSSMTGTKIQQLNDGIQRFRHEILQMP